MYGRIRIPPHTGIVGHTVKHSSGDNVDSRLPLDMENAAIVGSQPIANSIARNALSCLVIGQSMMGICGGGWGMSITIWLGRIPRVHAVPMSGYPGNARQPVGPHARRNALASVPRRQTTLGRTALGCVHHEQHGETRPVRFA